MRCWMHALTCALALPLAAALLAGCGADPAGITSRPLAGPAESAASAPTLSAAPRTDRATAAGGDLLEITLGVQAPRPLVTVVVTLHDGQGGIAGDAWLIPLDAQTWQGGLRIASGAPNGDYAVEVTLNDGAFTSGSRVRQSVYRFDADLSGERYRRSANAIAVQDGVFAVTPLGSELSALALTTVRIGAP